MGEIVERERKREKREEIGKREKRHDDEKSMGQSRKKKDMTTKGERNDTMRCESNMT